MALDNDPVGDVYQAALGRLIAHLRERVGLSQSELAKRVQLSQPTLSRVERGVSCPTLWTCRLIDRALVVTQAGGIIGLVEVVLAQVGDAACQHYAALGTTRSAISWEQIAAAPGGLTVLTSFLTLGIAKTIDGGCSDSLECARRR